MEKVRILAMLGLILSESAQVGSMIASKEAISEGMSNLVFIFYSNALSSLIFLPFSFLFRRSSERPRLTFSVLGGFFLLGLLGCVIQFLAYAGIYYSSPTLSTAMFNLIPAFTFVLAVTLRMEKFDWRSTISQAKTVGTIVSLIGALVVTFYDGPALLNAFLSSNPKLLSERSNWIFGGLLLLLVAAISSSGLIIQAFILKRYPVEHIMIFFYFFFVTILSAIACLVGGVRDPSAWSLKSKTRFCAVLYSGAFGSTVEIGVNTWCVRRTGPVFVTIFKPLGIIISVIVGVIFFGDTFYLGRLLGAVIIIAGFYSVLWGKAKEDTIENDDKDVIASLESSTHHEPLIQNSIEEHIRVS